MPRFVPQCYAKHGNLPVNKKSAAAINLSSSLLSPSHLSHLPSTSHKPEIVFSYVGSRVNQFRTRIQLKPKILFFLGSNRSLTAASAWPLGPCQRVAKIHSQRWDKIITLFYNLDFDFKWPIISVFLTWKYRL